MNGLDNKKILIINPFGIGDVLFTTPVISAIKNNDSTIFIGYWCNERVAPILRNNPYIDKIFPLSRGDIKKIFKKSIIQGIIKSLRLFFSIKKERFDISFDVSLDHRYNLISKLAGIKKRTGFNYKERCRFLTDKIYINGFTNRHVVDYYLEGIKKFLNIEIKSTPKIEVFLSDEDKKWADKFLEIHNLNEADLLIGISPAGGASWGENAAYLRWSEEKFAGLCNILIDKYNAKIILFGASNETGICDKIEGLLKRANIINTCGKLALTEFAALLSKCKIAICNDAGPLHIAVGLGIKAVCICGPVDEKVYGPYPFNEKQRIAKANLECQPCYKEFRMPYCQDRACLTNLEVETVLERVEELL